MPLGGDMKEKTKKKEAIILFNDMRKFLEFGGMTQDRAEAGARILIKFFDKRLK